MKKFLVIATVTVLAIAGSPANASGLSRSEDAQLNRLLAKKAIELLGAPRPDHVGFRQIRRGESPLDGPHCKVVRTERGAGGIFRRVVCKRKSHYASD